MRKVAMVGLSVMLAACASDTYITDVTTKSHSEEYAVAEVSQPVVSTEGTADGVTEENVAPRVITAVPEKSEPKVVAAAKQAPPKPSVAITPPTAKQLAANPRFGFTIQVVAVGTQDKVAPFVEKLPKNGQPIWENYKVMDGTKWYTVLYGDFATRPEATAAIKALPAEFQELKPFVKRIDSFKNSDYPTLTKLY